MSQKLLVSISSVAHKQAQLLSFAKCHKCIAATTLYLTQYIAHQFALPCNGHANNYQSVHSTLTTILRNIYNPSS